MSDGSTGIGTVDHLVIWVGAFVAVGGGLGLLWRLTRGARRAVHLIELFWDDWSGTEPRPGVPGRPGVMERLDRIEHELHPNSGASLRDAVDRVARSVGATPDEPEPEGHLATT